MMGFDFDTVVERRGTGCCKWDDLKNVFGRDDVLPLWVADMDFPAPPGVAEALRRRLDHPIYGYHTREDALFQAVIDWETKRHGWTPERQWLLNAPGVVPSVAAAILAFSGNDDEIIIQPPVYPPFSGTISKTGRKIVENPLKIVDGRYVPDFEDLEKKIGPKTKLLVLCSPHNPVGRVWTRDELSTLSEICLRRGVIVVSDEIHCDLVFKGYQHIPTASVSPAAAQNTITLISPSKSFNIAGTYTSFVVIPDPDKRKKFADVFDAIHIAAGNLFGLTAAEAAYRTGEEWLNELLPYLEANGEFLVKYTAEHMPQVKVAKPEGTYLGWMDFSAVVKDSAELRTLLLDKAKVGLNDGSAYGAGGTGFARINFACPRATLEEALERIAKALK